MRTSLLKMYYDLKESGSVSDFPNLLANVMHKILIDKFKGIASPWAQYVMKSDLSDFKTADRVIVAEAPDLLEVEDEGPYKDSKLKDYKYQIALKTFGRTFSIGRRAIINDDLNVLKKQPNRFGRATVRTLIKAIVKGIEGDGNTYDSKSMFHADHNNSGNTALVNTAAGAAAVAAGITAIRKATDPDTGEKMGIDAKFLLVPTDLGIVANQIVRSAQTLPVSTSGGGTLNGVTQLKVLEEPFLTSSTGWYVMADPNDCPVIEVGFLDGKETPDLLMKRADTIKIAGGDDEWGYDFDEIFFKVRHDWAVARAMYQGIYRGKA